ncbi:unnamed protein product [Rotaria sordida]|uniref:Uncharacterized protein n=1 Tax=Rotaria sordida TaxID=392033 RepID=A0A819EE08_9BILA|nr:unnamed protein product [Rotaria sordida]
MGIGNSNTSVDPVIKGSGSHNQIFVGDSALKVKNGTAVQEVMNTVGKTASKVIESGGDIITAPAVWLKDIQQNWLTYMVLAAIILSILAFFYCSFCFYFNRRKNNSSNNNLIELAKIINNKTGILQQQLPLSMLNLPSVSPNTPAELRV